MFPGADALTTHYISACNFFFCVVFLPRMHHALEAPCPYDVTHLHFNCSGDRDRETSIGLAEYFVARSVIKCKGIFHTMVITILREGDRNEIDRLSIAHRSNGVALVGFFLTVHTT